MSTSGMNFKFEFNNTFREKKDDLPLFMRQDGVQGSLRLTNSSAEAVDKIKLILRGFVYNAIDHGCEALYQPHRMLLQQRILRMIDVQDALDLRLTQAGTHEEIAKDIFHFNFQLHKARYTLDSSLADISGETIPCSIALFGPWCQHAAGKACCQAEVLIKYEVEARAYNGDECVGSLIQPIRIYDCADSNPAPLHTELFPDEYVSSVEQRLGTPVSVKKPTLRVSSSEPRPVEIRPCGDVAMAGLHLNFSLLNCAKPPKALNVRINSILKAMAFIATAKMTRQPTLKSSKSTPFVAAVPKWGRSYHRKLHITEWTSSYTKEGKSWNAKALVWMPISENSTPVPTFFTPFVARRYSMSLWLEVKGMGMGAGKTVLRLHIPVQIVYPTVMGEVPNYETAMSTPVSEEGQIDFEECEELPIYVR